MAPLSYPLFFSLNTVPVIPITIWVKETTAFPFVFIYGKCPAESAGNDIAEKLTSVQKFSGGVP